MRLVRGLELVYVLASVDVVVWEEGVRRGGERGLLSWGGGVTFCLAGVLHPKCTDSGLLTANC